MKKGIANKEGLFIIRSKNQKVTCRSFLTHPGSWCVKHNQHREMRKRIQKSHNYQRSRQLAAVMSMVMGW